MFTTDQLIDAIELARQIQSYNTDKYPVTFSYSTSRIIEIVRQTTEN